MKKLDLLKAASAIALAAGVTAPSSSDAVPLRADTAELAAYSSAISSGSAEDLQGYLTQHPDSAHAKEVFGELLHLAAHNSRGFEASGNPRAAGGPENPGRGRGVTAHY